MPSGGGGGQTTTVQKNDPWGPLQEPFKQVIDDYQKLYEGGQASLYPGLTIASRSNPTMLAEELTLGRALNGSQVTDNANKLATDTLNGDYLNSNPYLDATFNKAADQVQNRVDSMFSRSGRTGSGSHAGVASDKLNDLATNIYGGNYANERNNQMSTMSMAPTIANQDYNDIGKIAAVGSQRDQFNQQMLNEAIQRFNYNENGDRNNAKDFLSVLNSINGGSTATSSQSGGGNGLAGTLGGLGSAASGAASLYSALPAAGFGWQAALAGLPWSDSRLKKDIKHVGTQNGHNVYEFKYKDDKQNRIYRGVMAQEVAEINPYAVGERYGYMTVDYDKIGVEFKEVV
jgi:hypothetical protein